MKKEKIRLTGMTILTALMVFIVIFTFPVKPAHLHKEHGWVLVSRIYVQKADTDCVLMSDGRTVNLKDIKEEEKDKICGRVLLSSMEGFR